MVEKVIKKIKSSIGIKLILLLSLVIVVSVSITMLFSNFLLPEYYAYSKQKSIKQLYTKLKQLTDKDTNLDKNDNREVLNEMCESYGATIVVVNGDGLHIYEYGNEQMLKDRWREIIFGSSLSIPNEKNIIEENDNYIIQSLKDNVTGRNYYEIYGELSSGNYFVIRMSVENIRENVHIANRFYIMMAIVLLIVTIVVIGLIARKYTKPIMELSDISKRMSDLDFEVKYTAKSDDELGILGNNMNDLSDKLEKTIGELKNANAKLSQDIKKREEIDKMRTDFISSVSHDLKTPIALISGYAEGLQDGIATDPEDIRYYCDVIMDEANKMNKMVKNLLSLNQLEFEDNKLEIIRFNITELITNIIKNLDIEFKKKDVNIIFDKENDIFVWADEYQIEHVLVNYIQNAINYVNQSGDIIIKIIPKGNIARITIFNTGSHIPDEELKYIWDKFYKVDKARTRKYGGNGIGLSIVKIIMERHNKEYGVKNLDNGVEFYFELDTTTTTKQGE